jgi:hypothetical protein
MSQFNNQFSPTCPEDCDSLSLPIFDTACFSAETIEESEIEEIFFCDPSETPGVPTVPISGWTKEGLAADATINEAAITAWYAAKNNAGSSTMKSIKGIGDKPATTSTEIVGDEGVKIKVDKTHPLNFDVQTLTNLNYEALRTLECGGPKHIWFRTRKYFYGGKNGMLGTIVNVDHILARGRGSIATDPIQIEWIAATSPPRDKWIAAIATEGV